MIRIKKQQKFPNISHVFFHLYKHVFISCVIWHNIVLYLYSRYMFEMFSVLCFGCFYVVFFSLAVLGSGFDVYMKCFFVAFSGAFDKLVTNRDQHTQQGQKQNPKTTRKQLENIQKKHQKENTRWGKKKKHSLNPGRCKDIFGGSEIAHPVQSHNQIPCKNAPAVELGFGCLYVLVA